MKTLLLLLLSTNCYAQKFELKKHKWSLVATFSNGLFDGVRDASMYRMDGLNNWWNGKNSWLNKYKNRDMAQGPAYFLSTSAFIAPVDAPHTFNLLGHQAETMSIIIHPECKNKKFWHVVKEAAIYNLTRSAGHYITYDLIKYRK